MNFQEKNKKKKPNSPGLGLSKVKVVDTVKVHVLSVPGKCGLPHAKVEVGSVYSLDNNPTLLLYHIQECVEVANVPLLNVLYRDKQFYDYYLQSIHYTQSFSQNLSKTTDGVIVILYKSLSKQYYLVPFPFQILGIGH